MKSLSFPSEKGLKIRHVPGENQYTPEVIMLLPLPSAITTTCDWATERKMSISCRNGPRSAPADFHFTPTEQGTNCSYSSQGPPAANWGNEILEGEYCGVNVSLGLDKAQESMECLYAMGFWGYHKINDRFERDPIMLCFNFKGAGFLYSTYLSTQA